jgi:hypothetical protein
MDNRIFIFEPIKPRHFRGRYRRPQGEESAYHVSAQGIITVRWRDRSEEYRFESKVKQSPAVQDLAQAVNEAKRRATGWRGGSFVIDEFGQVISPVQQSRDRFLVGKATGPLYFEDPWQEDKWLSLQDLTDLQCGDEWLRPYLGMQYQLHGGDHIYFWQEDAEGARKLYPKKQDLDLIEKLRLIRPNGAVRFIVNQYGIVLTQKPVGRNVWKPVYVGRINYDLWFEPEG